jgi:flagellar basal-body rod protein FlgB
MTITDLVNAGSIPTLELTARYAAGRQALLAHNIANISTPDFRPQDVPPREFQRVLREAIDARRRGGRMAGPLEWRPTRQIQREPGGGLRLTPRTPARGVLFHDQNNRDLERLMQDLAENVGAFRLATDLLRGRYTLLREAIGERV